MSEGSHQHLARSNKALTATVADDPLTRAVIAPFDLDPTAPIEFYPWVKPELPEHWQLGLILGSSGTGKSTLLREFGASARPGWTKERSVASHFKSAKDARNRLAAVGLNSIPTWRKPYAVLSTGERFRVDLARVIGPGAVVDEYTSVVSRPVAKSASRALRRWASSQEALNMTLASCHRDIVEWLEPDWIIDTDAGVFHVGERTPRAWWLGLV